MDLYIDSDIFHAFTSASFGRFYDAQDALMHLCIYAILTYIPFFFNNHSINE